MKKQKYLNRFIISKNQNRAIYYTKRGRRVELKTSNNINVSNHCKGCYFNSFCIKVHCLKNCFKINRNDREDIIWKEINKTTKSLKTNKKPNKKIATLSISEDENTATLTYKDGRPSIYLKANYTKPDCWDCALCELCYANSLDGNIKCMAYCRKDKKNISWVVDENCNKKPKESKSDHIIAPQFEVSEDQLTGVYTNSKGERFDLTIKYGKGNCSTCFFNTQCDNKINHHCCKQDRKDDLFVSWVNTNKSSPIVENVSSIKVSEDENTAIFTHKTGVKTPLFAYKVDSCHCDGCYLKLICKVNILGLIKCCKEDRKDKHFIIWKTQDPELFKENDGIVSFKVSEDENTATLTFKNNLKIELNAALDESINCKECHLDQLCPDDIGYECKCINRKDKKYIVWKVSKIYKGE